MKIKKEVKIGIVAVLAICLLVYGLNYLKGSDIFKKELTYYGIYDHVDGLNPSSPVLINGYQVGQVSSIKLAKDGTNNLLVTFTIREEIGLLPKESIAMLASTDILGSKGINLMLGNSFEETKDGDTLWTENELELSDQVNATIAPLKQKAEELLGSVDSAVIIVQSILNKDARNDLSGSLDAINKTFINFERISKDVEIIVGTQKVTLGKIMTNVDGITGDLEASGQDYRNTMFNLSRLSDSIASADLDGAVDKAAKAMEDISETMEKVNSGEGTIGQLIQNDSLYQNLENASLELDKLIEDMRVNPKRYVHFSLFGKKDKDKPEKRDRDN